MFAARRNWYRATARWNAGTETGDRVTSTRINAWLERSKCHAEMASAASLWLTLITGCAAALMAGRLRRQEPSESAGPIPGPTYLHGARQPRESATTLW